jgi:hypothetical protein
MSRFVHVPHPHIQRRKDTGPVTVTRQRFAGKGKIGKIGALAGLRITTIVGTMSCAAVFVALAVYGLPTALKAGPSGLVLWTSSEFLQLVLLPVIIVGQNVQAKAADKRAEATFNDAEAVLHECLELQKHLQAQDEILERATAQADARHDAALDYAAGQHQLLTAQAARQHEELRSRIPVPEPPPVPATPACKPAGRNTQ